MPLSGLDLIIKEADMRLVPHAINATHTGAKTLAILSGNTCHGSSTFI